MLLEPFQYAMKFLIMFVLSFSINDNIVGDILASREACEYLLDCLLEDLGCCVNSKREALVSLESDVCAECGIVVALWCQLQFVVSKRKVQLAENCGSVEVSDQIVDGRHQVFFSFNSLVGLSHVYTYSHLIRALRDYDNRAHPEHWACYSLDDF